MAGIIGLITGIMTLGGVGGYIESLFTNSIDFEGLLIGLLSFAGFIKFVILSAYEDHNEYEHNKKKMNIYNCADSSDKILKTAQKKWWGIFGIVSLVLIIVGVLKMIIKI